MRESNVSPTEKDGRGVKGSLLNVEHWQVISLYLVIYDIAAVTMSYFLAIWFRFDCSYSLIWPEILERSPTECRLFSPV